MRKIKTYLFLSLLALVTACFFSTCKYVSVSPVFGNYPSDVGKIFVTKCAVSGCHNEITRAAGLCFSTWDKMFEGSEEGASVIPYRHDFSSVCYHINTFADLGTTLSPTMPNGKTPLTRDEVKLIMDWVDKGAPNEFGTVAFADNPNRKKFYVTNQGCDVVTVFDAETLLQMRVVTVGNSQANEAPHNVKVSPDGRFWYVISTGGNSLQKYRTSDDSYVGQAILGSKNWNTITISSTGDTAFVVDWSSSGDIAVVNLNTFSVGHNIGFSYPHGSCMSPDGQYLYVSQNSAGSDQIYKIQASDFTNIQIINLYTTVPSTHLDSHEILFSPAGDKYFVTCQGTDEVRIMDAATDAFIAALPVGAVPSEMAVSASHNLLFVTCEEDSTSFAGQRGSIAIIDISTNAFAAGSPVYSGHQPHGLALDDDKNLVMVANRNVTSDGPAPHHSNNCGGRNGYVTFIDMNTLTLLTTDEGEEKEIEVSVDPYSIATRH